MLKLNSKIIIQLVGIAVLTFTSCTNENAKVHDQNKATEEKKTSSDAANKDTSNKTTQLKFIISIEGYKATPLGQAVYDGDLPKVLYLIKNGASVKECLTDETYNYDILYTALTFNKIEIIRYVLSNKLYDSVNQVYTEEAETPLTLACALKNNNEALEIAESLIVLGANVNGAGESGGERTLYPLFIAVEQNNINLTKLLLEHGANKDIQNENGETPLTTAEQKDYNEIADLLRTK